MRALSIIQILLLFVSVLACCASVGSLAVQFQFIQNPWLTGGVLLFFTLTSGATVLLQMIKVYGLRSVIYVRKKSRSAAATFQQSLNLACIAISEGHEFSLRSNIFLKDLLDNSKISIAFYSTNMKGASDLDMRLERWQGATGQAWGYRNAVVADMTQMGSDGSPRWNLTDDQLKKTAHLKAVLSVPIFHPNAPSQIIGLLSFDSTEDLAHFFLTEKCTRTAAEVASSIGFLLDEFGMAQDLNYNFQAGS